jgi:hypothetical protein
MSGYSLQILDREKYFNEFDENIIYSFDKYVYQKNFRVGKGIEDKKELAHDLIFSRILCTDNCEMINYIQCAIEGELEKRGKTFKSNKSISEILKIAQQYLEEQDCTLEEAIACQSVWTTAQW